MVTRAQKKAREKRARLMQEKQRKANRDGPSPDALPAPTPGGAPPGEQLSCHPVQLTEDQVDALPDREEGIEDDDEEYDAQEKRWLAILGDLAVESQDGVVKFYAHLKRHLTLPCLVTGSEDFKWEEFYLWGPGDPDEYRKLKKTQPSHKDRFELLGLDREGQSEWLLFQGADIGARVRRLADGREFILGLAELEAVDKRSPNHQLVDDYATWLVNNR